MGCFYYIPTNIIHFPTISTIFVVMKTFLRILTIFIAVGAIGGAVMMWMDPTGVSWGGEPMPGLAETAAAYYE